MKKIIFLLCMTMAVFYPKNAHADKMLIPMDFDQSDHLKAYGVAYHALGLGMSVEWLLNYRCGSFLIDVDSRIQEYALVRGVSFVILNEAALMQMDTTIEQSNMSRELLEKCPKVAVYTPPNTLPWDDAVTLALTYAEIPYETLWDDEVLAGKLTEYDWLHLHHEDFTGQYGKFYRTYRNQDWYISQQKEYEAIAAKLGYKKVSDEKKAVAEAIREYVVNGGFLFAMCSATDTFDIALAARGVDIAERSSTATRLTRIASHGLTISRTLAFENFKLVTDPFIYEFSDIDATQELTGILNETNAMDYFELFEFSAKYDPVPTMLTQDHENPIRGFMGQTTDFKKDLIKKNILILGENRAAGDGQVHPRQLRPGDIHVPGRPRSRGLPACGGRPADPAVSPQEFSRIPADPEQCAVPQREKERAQNVRRSRNREPELGIQESGEKSRETDTGYINRT